MSVRPSVRFEVLKRDSFTCQYCGKAAPDVELEVDHVVARSRGGSDEAHNLVTSCKNCNRGKGARSLESPLVPDVSKEADRLAQVRRYEEERIRLRQLEEEELDQVMYRWRRAWTDEEPHRIYTNVWRGWLRKHGFETVCEAIRVTRLRLDSPVDAHRYLGGVLRNWETRPDKLPEWWESDDAEAAAVIRKALYRVNTNHECMQEVHFDARDELKALAADREDDSFFERLSAKLDAAPMKCDPCACQQAWETWSASVEALVVDGEVQL